MSSYTSCFLPRCVSFDRFSLRARVRRLRLTFLPCFSHAVVVRLLTSRWRLCLLDFLIFEVSCVNWRLFRTKAFVALRSQSANVWNAENIRLWRQKRSHSYFQFVLVFYRAFSKLKATVVSAKNSTWNILDQQFQFKTRTLMYCVMIGVQNDYIGNSWSCTFASVKHCFRMKIKKTAPECRGCKSDTSRTIYGCDNLVNYVQV